jgi:hypothetical protein
VGAAAVIALAARRRAMMAAESVETSTVREAAIVGGIVRCVIAAGKINGPWVSQYAADMLAEFNIRDIDRSPPNLAEMAGIVERFQQSYSQPFGG